MTSKLTSTAEAADQYVTCAGLLDKATQYPGSSVFEIAAAGVPLSKLVRIIALVIHEQADRLLCTGYW